MTRKEALATAAASLTAATLAVTMLVSDQAHERTQKFAFDGDTVEVTVKMKPRKVDTVFVKDTAPPVPPAIKYPLPFGPFHERTTNINAGLNYTGSMKFMETSAYKDTLLKVQANKGQIFLGLTTKRHQFRSKTDTTKLNLAHWRAYVIDTVYKPRMATIKPFIDDSTIKGIYVVDEPECVACWRGARITLAQVDSMAMYARQLFKGSDGKSLPTAVRMDPSKMTHSWKHVDLSWAQYSGATHFPAAGPPLGQWAKKRAASLVGDTTRVSVDSLYYVVGKVFADSMTKAAKARGLGMVLGINSMDGGDGYSKMKGISSHPTRWIISPAEYSGLMRAFVEHDFACGVFNWKSSFAIGSNETVANRTAALAFDTLTAVRQANARARLIALARPAGKCSWR